MENLTNTITDLIINDNNIIITYDNSSIEIIPITLESYKNMYNFWIINEPVFISDKFKSVLNLLILVNNDDKYVSKLNEFFNEGNVVNVKAFIIYMRGRKEYLAIEKLKWTTK